MNSLRTEDDYKRAIKDLLQQAETSLESDLQARDGDRKRHVRPRCTALMRGLDIAITEEATVRCAQSFWLFSVFDTKRSKTRLSCRGQVVRPLIEEWINRYMADIAREVITEVSAKSLKCAPRVIYGDQKGRPTENRFCVK